MHVAKDALVFVIVLGIAIFASGVGIYYFYSRKHQTQAAALKNNQHSYDVESQATMSPKQEPKPMLWRSQSDGGPRTEQPSATCVSLPRSHSAGAMVGLARPPLAYVARWPRPAKRPRPVLPLAPAKSEDGHPLESKVARKSRFIEHL
ncbi:hypothetical protein PpBr36_02507 [Pyricularia pennisetigena]|uniref:hypothetical protein n=1 Tax=Pyricularia pennisetigena TaxID=1578925 RepID=UPI001153D6D5|nr:hypothetical protein PpBr36_02507 [Pyricularia pennisetigena]TLS30633.1 hypothetical protein PpBr36_02507 [Pyricularia pennisetigena]